MLERVRRRVGRPGAGTPVPTHVPIAAVRVLHRIDQHDEGVQDPCRFVGADSQVICGPQGGLRGGRLVPVHAISQPDDGRHLARHLGCPRRGQLGTPELADRSSDLLQAIRPILTKDRKQDERSSLGRLAVADQRDARRCRRQPARVPKHPGRVGEALARPVAQDIGRRRHRLALGEPDRQEQAEGRRETDQGPPARR